MDWEDAAIGTAVSDVACARAELMVMYGEAAMAQFMSRYLAGSGIAVDDLLLWDVY
jgi:thiamine kinase-like enzyme